MKMVLIIEGDTLGEKRRCYNDHVQKALKRNEQYKLEPINFDDPDLNNLYKIDIASRRRDVKYILEVLKCQDMLYVSRAIKQTEWLIKDEKYSNIINPKYLHEDLFPQMNTKAKNKFMLHIRLTLKDEKRVEGFLNYIKNFDLNSALKWLQNCSVAFIEKAIEEHAKSITVSQIKRLCEKSITFLDVYCKYTWDYNKAQAFQATTFLLQNETQKYMDIIHACHASDAPQFGPKYTKIIMKKCPNIILDNFERYALSVDLPVFVTYLKQEEIQQFILKLIKNKKLRFINRYDNIKHFLKRLPKDITFEFVKQVFIEKTIKYEDDEEMSDIIEGAKCCRMACAPPTPTFRNMYRWYTFATFTVALTDLKKMIRNESNPTERIAIWEVILNCAGKNMQNIQTVIKLYRDHHINEPFKFKIKFVNHIISKTDTHKYDAITWSYLNDLFTSMEVYEESNNNVESCIRSIILYNIIRDENIPRVVEHKFEFDTYKTSLNKLNTEEKGKLFQFLYAHLLAKLNKCVTTDEQGYSEAVDTLEKLLCLLKDWNRNLNEYPLILEKIREFIQIKINNSWKTELSCLYNTNKAWKQILFKESIFLNPTRDSCLNALKHEPKLLEINKYNIENIYLNETVSVTQLLKTVRVFWPQTFASDVTSFYFSKMEERIYHKAIVSGLCILLPPKDILELIHKYAPCVNKIDWSQHNEIELSLQKNIAKRLYTARPQPPLSTVLLYTKGDYLQYALPSLSSILHNMDCIQARRQINDLLNAPVSIQKHGISVALDKLESDDAKKVLENTWNTTKNSTIRAAIFKQTFKMLKKEKYVKIAKEIWEILSVFIDKLTSEENKLIYITLSKAYEVPHPIRVDFWIKSYTFLKNLPKKENCSDLYYNLKRNMTNITEFLNVDFAKDMFLESFEKDNENYSDAYYLVDYLYSSNDEETQKTRYENVLFPIFEKANTLWDKQVKGVYCTRHKIKQIITYLSREFNTFVLDNKMVMPIAMLTNILQKHNTMFSKHENYVSLTHLKLTISYIKHIDKIMKTEENKKEIDNVISKYKNNWNLLYSQTIPEFAHTCMEYLKGDVKQYFPSIYLLFAEALDSLLHIFCDTDTDKLKTLQVFLDYEDIIEGQLMIFRLLPNYCYADKDKALKYEILKKLSANQSHEVQMHYWCYQESNMNI